MTLAARPLVTAMIKPLYSALAASDAHACEVHADSDELTSLLAVPLHHAANDDDEDCTCGAWARAL